MSYRRTNRIRNIIRDTKAEPGQVAQLQSLIRTIIPRLHGAIQLPQRDPETALSDFIFRYIDHAPNFMDALGGLTKEAGIHNYADIFLRIAADFFLEPPDLAQRHSGLRALMDRAYLAHRLIEEINDRVVGRCGIPLAPMDMTRANLIMHQLIGEPFANDLDVLVHYATELHSQKEQLMETKAFHRYIQVHKIAGWDRELDRWPCLAEDLSINVSFGADQGLAKKGGKPKAIH